MSGLFRVPNQDLDYMLLLLDIINYSNLNIKLDTVIKKHTDLRLEWAFGPSSMVILSIDEGPVWH